MQIMFFDEQTIKLGLLMRFKQPHLDPLHHIYFVSNLCDNHAASLQPRREKIQPFFNPAFALCNLPSH